MISLIVLVKTIFLFYARRTRIGETASVFRWLKGGPWPNTPPSPLKVFLVVSTKIKEGGERGDASGSLTRLGF